MAGLDKRLKVQAERCYTQTPSNKMRQWKIGWHYLRWTDEVFQECWPIQGKDQWFKGDSVWTAVVNGEPKCLGTVKGSDARLLCRGCCCVSAVAPLILSEPTP